MARYLLYPGQGPTGTNQTARWSQSRQQLALSRDIVTDSKLFSATGGLNPASSNLGHDALVLLSRDNF